MSAALPLTRSPGPREDYGFFGPGSATWQVWPSATSFIGFQRAVTIETFDPFLTAAVVDLGGVRTNPKGRFDRTAGYFMTVALGDGASAVRASRALMRFHERAVGTEPVSGLPYSANDPDSQLWIHVTAWHSILKCFEVFGPGTLDEATETRYWEECALAAELQTCDPATVPRSRQEVREYFARERPRLALSDDGRALFHYLLRPPIRRDARLLSTTFRALAPASVATMPRWMRRLAGVDQSRVLDAAAIASTRAGMVAASSARARLNLVARLAPSAAPYMASVLHGERPVHERTVTPAQAREAAARVARADGHRAAAMRPAAGRRRRLAH